MDNQQLDLISPQEAYKKNIVKKIADIEAHLPTLQKKWGTDELLTFYELVHKIFNLSDIAGDQALKSASADLESYLNTLVDTKQITEDDVQRIQIFITEMKSISEIQQREIYEDAFLKNQERKVLYIYEDNIEWAKYLTQQLAAFNYTVKIFSDIDIFTYFLHHHDFTAAIINAHLLTSEIEDQLLQLKTIKDKTKPAIFFTASSGDILLRLKAVRLGGEAFFLKPFMTEEIITKLDRLDEKKQKEHRVLIVDDDVSTALSFSKILENAGMQALIITDFTRINHALGEFAPDAILMDLYMPHCDGMELAAIIRQQALYESIPIIYLSSEKDRTKQLDAMSLGADDFLDKSVSPDILVYTIKNRIHRYKNIRNLIVNDTVTNVYTHSFMQNQLLTSVKLANRLNMPISVAMIDVDHLKRINDIYGFDAGDQVLRSAALLFRKRLRETDIVGRYSGGKFLIIFQNTPPARAKNVLDDIREEFAYFSHLWQNKTFFASFSVGVVGYPHYHSAFEIIDGVKRALNNAKSLGRNRIEMA